MNAGSTLPARPPSGSILWSVASFGVAFAVYTAAAVFLLVLGMGAALAAGSPPVADAFRDAAVDGGRIEPVWRTMLAAAPLSEPPTQVVVDYLLSALNLGLGVFLVWRRPRDRVARLLGLGMVGTAASFNLQVHTAFVVVDAAAPALHLIVPLHWMLHAVSGATYLNALVVFPNGRVVPRQLVWLVSFAYLLMAEEIGLTFVTGSVGLLAVPFQLLFGFQGTDPAVLPRLVASDATFVVLFFGMLLPLAGATSQVYRYVAVSDREERQRTRLVVWSLTLAFGVGLAALALAVALGFVRGVGLATQVRGETTDAAFRVVPLLFGIVPVALFTAMLRHRLFDLDLVIVGTLVYGVLTAILATTFFATVFVLQRLLRELIGGPNELAVAAAALLNGLLFQPARRRLQRRLDRVLRRRPHEAAAALATFRSSLVGQELDLSALEERLVATVRQVLHPSRVGIWLREPKPE
jgi:hypothetical protein